MKPHIVNEEGIMVAFPHRVKNVRRVKPEKSPLDAYLGSDTLTLKQAAELIGITERAVRRAIHDGKLKAFIPGGGKVAAPGAGMGYRIHKRDLQAWWFGADSLPKEDQDVRP